MDDPYFDATISAVRGFDLGDDTELLATLVERAPDLSAEEWLLHAVLLVRAGKAADALGPLDHAVATRQRADDEPALSLIHYLRARLLSRQGRTAASGEALDAAERAAEADGRISEGELAHARALGEWEAGRLEDALRMCTHGLAVDGSSAARWRDKGSLLLELQRPEDAIDALRHALMLAPDDDTAMGLFAFAEAALGNAEDAAHWIEQTLHLAPQRREALAADPMLAPVRHHPAVARRLEPPPPPDPRWMDVHAPWISALRYAMQRGEHRRHAIEWLEEDEAKRITARMTDDHQRGPIGTMHSATTLQVARDLLAQRLVIARGPGTTTRDGAEERCIIAMGRGPYSELYVAPSEVYPAFLWIAAGRDGQSLCAVLDGLSPRPQLSRADMPQQVRGFLGYRERIVVPSPISGRLEPAAEEELDRHFTLNPFVESAGWGSAFAEDPWPDDIPNQPGVVLKIEARRRELAEQGPGAVWSMTRRLRHSRGYFGIERHQGEVFVASVCYRPASHRSTIAAVNERFGTEYPLDMPVDAVAALIGFQFDSAADLQAKLATATEPGDIAGLLVVIAALRHSDLDLQKLLCKHAQHDDPIVRSTICNIAMEYNFESLLEIMSVSEPDLQLRAEIECVLDEGIPPPVPARAEDEA